MAAVRSCFRFVECDARSGCQDPPFRISLVRHQDHDAAEDHHDQHRDAERGRLCDPAEHGGTRQESDYDRSDFIDRDAEQQTNEGDTAALSNDGDGVSRLHFMSGSGRIEPWRR